MHAFNLSALEAGVGGSFEFKASMLYITSFRTTLRDLDSKEEKESK